MIIRKTVITIITAGIFFIPQTAFAVTTPSFASCVNPQGSLKASYDTGKHGVVGVYSEKTGSDKVYQLSGNNQLIQCFCPTNGSGTQTNWLKINNLSTADVQTLKNEGWIYVSEGSAWGLDNGQYLAKNIDYTCNSTTTSVGSTNPIHSVLSLANTGNIVFLYSTAVAGIISIIAGFTLRFKNK